PVLLRNTDTRHPRRRHRPLARGVDDVPHLVLRRTGCPKLALKHPCTRKSCTSKQGEPHAAIPRVIYASTDIGGRSGTCNADRKRQQGAGCIAETSTFA